VASVGAGGVLGGGGGVAGAAEVKVKVKG
jgi:hypothetical protein